MLRMIECIPLIVMVDASNLLIKFCLRKYSTILYKPHKHVGQYVAAEI